MRILAGLSLFIVIKCFQEQSQAIQDLMTQIDQSFNSMIASSQSQTNRLRGFSKEITINKDGTTTTQINNLNDSDQSNDFNSELDQLLMDPFEKSQKSNTSNKNIKKRSSSIKNKDQNAKQIQDQLERIFNSDSDIINNLFKIGFDLDQGFQVIKINSKNNFQDETKVNKKRQNSKNKKSKNQYNNNQLKSKNPKDLQTQSNKIDEPKQDAPVSLEQVNSVENKSNLIQSLIYLIVGCVFLLFLFILFLVYRKNMNKKKFKSLENDVRAFDQGKYD